MLYTIRNEQITVKINSVGAEIVSVRHKDCEYIWQGDPALWKDHSPLLFPICGRLFEGHYTYAGKTYTMELHGFARHMPFACVSEAEDRLILRITATEQTRAVYPFGFELTVEYRLTGNRLLTRATIRNTGGCVLPATFGGHPGFRVPLDGGSFEDYYIEFGEECSPDMLILSDSCLNTGRKQGFPLRDGRILPLRHSLFDNDAIFMSRMADRVTLKSGKSDRSVTLYYPDMPYFGLWHAPRTEAPYVCLEPWCGLPAYDGVTDDMERKNDMFRIPVGSEKTVSFEITFG